MASVAKPSRPPTVLAALAVAAMTLVFAVLLFWPAGRLDWTLGWIHIGMLVAWFGVTWACLQQWNPVLIERRARMPKGTKAWDKAWAALFAPFMLAIYVVAGYEARDGAMTLPPGAWVPGLALFLAGTALLTWSMVANPFFEKTVRIQTEHGHRVVDTGPYAYVRHPGYVGFVGWVVATPLLLGSAWALIPALLSVVGIAVRTALEDRTLRAELPGYREYAARVRSRLVPGLW